MSGTITKIGTWFRSRVTKSCGAALATSILLQAIAGCSSNGASAVAGHRLPPLTTYPNQVFSTGKPGQLGLWIEGEDWQLRADMSGFQHHDEWPFVSASQFFFMRNETRTTASVFAERIEGANSEESCRRYYSLGVKRGRDMADSVVRDQGTVSPVSEVKTHGKIVQVFEFSYARFGPDFWRKVLHWFPYYRGFCFDFHFEYSSAVAEKEVLQILDSVTYLAQKPRDTDIDRLFYLFDWLRIRLSIPIDWRYFFRPPPPGRLGGIELQPDKGANFSFVIAPLGSPRSTALSDQPEGIVEQDRRSDEERGETVTPLRSQCSAEACVSYFDLTIRRDDSAYSDAIETHGIKYHRKGFVKLGDTLIAVSLLYRDDSRAAAEHLTNAISRAKVLDLIEFHKSVKQDHEALVR